MPDVNGDPTLEELQAKASQRKRQSTRPTEPKPAEKKAARQDVLNPTQRRARNVEVLAKQFQGINEGIALRTGDAYYEVSEAEALQWSEAMIDTGEWMGISEIPPPLTLLAITLNIYIPRAFHYWVYGRDVGEPTEEELSQKKPEWEPSPA